MLGSCKTRDAGGCYCICRLIDSIETCKSILSGDSFKRGSIYIPPGKFRDKFIATLSDEEKSEDMKFAAEELIKLQEILKNHEV